MVAAQFQSKLNSFKEKFAVLWRHLDIAMLSQAVGVTNEIAGKCFTVGSGINGLPPDYSGSQFQLQKKGFLLT
jgi:hypothetical protein